MVQRSPASVTGRWPHWTGHTDAEGKRVLLRNTEIYGRSGWNSDGKQQNILSRALRGRTDYIEIGADHHLVTKYISTARYDEPVAWRIFGEELVNQEIVSLSAKAMRYAKPTVYAYTESDDQSMEGRIAALSTKGIETCAAQFGIVHPTHMDVILDEAREIVRQGYAKYNDPKKVRARERNASRGSLIKLRKPRG